MFGHSFKTKNKLINGLRRYNRRLYLDGEEVDASKQARAFEVSPQRCLFSRPESWMQVHGDMSSKPGSIQLRA